MILGYTSCSETDGKSRMPVLFKSTAVVYLNLNKQRMSINLDRNFVVKQINVLFSKAPSAY